MTTTTYKEKTTNFNSISNQILKKQANTSKQYPYSKVELNNSRKNQPTRMKIKSSVLKNKTNSRAS